MAPDYSVMPIHRHVVRRVVSVVKLAAKIAFSVGPSIDIDGVVHEVIVDVVFQNGATQHYI